MADQHKINRRNEKPTLCRKNKCAGNIYNTEA